MCLARRRASGRLLPEGATRGGTANCGPSSRCSTLKTRRRHLPQWMCATVKRGGAPGSPEAEALGDWPKLAEAPRAKIGSGQAAGETGFASVARDRGRALAAG